MNARRLILATAVALCALAGGPLSWGAPAQAAVIHRFLGQESPEAYKPVNETGPVAVDESTSLTDWAKGDVYEVVPHEGTYGGVVDVFEPEGGGKRKLVAQLTGNSPSEPFEYLGAVVAVNDTNGDVIINDYEESKEKRVLRVFEPTVFGKYAFVGTIASPIGSLIGQGGGLAIDQSSGEIYVVDDHPGESSIDEFSSTGAHLSRIDGTPAGGFTFGGLRSMTVDPITHDLYVLDEGHSVVDIFGPDITVPDVTTGPVSHLMGRSATLTGTVNPDKAGAATCQFQWGTTTKFGHTAPCSAPVAEGASPVPVEAQLSGLEPDSSYCYRLQATDANGANPGEPSQDRCFTTAGLEPHPATVAAVTAESATLDATVDPRGTPTAYYFQYGTTSAYGTDVPAAPGVPVGSGEGAVQVSQHVQGLQASTVYHYRVVELVEPGGTVEELDGPDQTFTTQRSNSELGLPDGRQWEMVTPPDKRGALFYGLNWGYTSNCAGCGAFVAEASAGGGAMIDLASVPTEAEPQGNASIVSVLSTRGPAGWSSQVIATPHDEATGPAVGEGGEYRFFSEDLSRGVMQQFGNSTPLSPEASETTPYLRADYLNGNVNEHCQSACYQPLVTRSNTQAGAVFGGENNGECVHTKCGPVFIDATPDLSHVVLRSEAQLMSVPDPGGLYVWSGGVLAPLYMLPKSEGGQAVAAGNLGQRAPIDHQLADNGVFFAGGSHLDLHDFAKGESVRLDVAQGVAEPSVGGAEFLYASSDGSRVLFTDPKQLTKASGGGIYECRIVEGAGGLACELELTGLSGGAFVGGSKDASYLYFMGAGERLIVDHNTGRVWTTTEGPVIPQTATSGLQSSGSELPNYRVSPNGRFIAFMSDRNLTGYDNRDAISGQSDEEVYLYDASSNRLVCASCNPTGARPVGAEYSVNALTGGNFGFGSNTGIWVAANLPPWTVIEGSSSQLYQPRFLSDNGRLFFDSNDALVPQDVNGAEDVYEYEPAGVGSCSAASATFGERSGGCVGLISSGSSPEESAFLDASETGGDVFFLTSAKLAPQDYDNALDVYDAHECFAAVPCYPPAPVSPPACTTGDACKAAPTPQPPIFGSPSSATFAGAGNVASGSPAVGSRSLTRTQRLARALAACRRKRHRQRGVCERGARRRYGRAGGSARAGVKHEGRG